MFGGGRDTGASRAPEPPGEEPRTQEKEETERKGVMASDASHALEAALEQMDGIIAGAKTGADIRDGSCEPALASPVSHTNPFPVLHLVEDLRLALEMLEQPQERAALLSQIPGPTAAYIKESLSQVNHQGAASNETYQERLARLEGDKESLILQVSVLTDQVEAQGEKIRDLEVCLEGHQVKLNAAEEMLQQELLSRTSLETQKLDLMTEVSELKLKLVGMEKEQREQEEKQRKAEELLQELKHLKIKVEELENERNQYEWKLKATKDSPFLVEHKYPTFPGKLSGATPNGAAAKSTPTAPQLEPTGSSLPRLRDTESGWDDTVVANDLSSTSSGTDSSPQSPLTPDGKRSPKGIRKFWGKIRRTQSGNFNTDAPGMAEFRRGGLRATAGPRLSRTRDPKGQKCDASAPFAQWSTERVCAWLEDFGLGQYVIFARQWVTSGHTLLSATPQDMEKELGIKQPLHRKKLILAVKAINTKQEEKSALLDHIWVTRWLDDIGLPQYKDQFHESRVDGRMLQYLTVNDLLFLKVTSQLHHLSIKCAIHVLHVNNFNPHCLHRRPADESNLSPSEVVQWSNHRVMEWLRSVDLAEYAPNLRGSGVHGGLIILEPRFTGDTLAMLLNIPPQKTLLRRHLTTKFSALIGPEAEQEKREKIASPAYTPLTTTAKVRPRKLGFSHFGNIRKKKFDESTDYICPMEPSDSVGDSHRAYSGYRGLSPLDAPELDRLDQVGQIS
uniref:Liprin-beta-2 isoform X4 n=1 Tax=Callorhinus ursinus TaxID=34884 RepID=A0A3Q7S8P6_CALUR|nr:liprin-beta-2 isoform X4 [Callorhinus ursinus]